LYDEPLGDLPTAVRTGYTFAGWYTLANGGKKVTTITHILADVTLYAHWTPNYYSVRFKSQGGSPVTSLLVGYSQAIGTLKTPKRSGYKFLGWYTKASGGNKISASTNVKSDVTYYAHWVRLYTVKWNANKGKVKKTSISVAKGAKVGSLQKPTRSGYKFLGWYTKKSGGSKISKNTKISKTKTYYAHWKRK
jgi:uncharacterized repeat protein (TIGR02543 family)